MSRSRLLLAAAMAVATVGAQASAQSYLLMDDDVFVSFSYARFGANYPGPAGMSEDGGTMIFNAGVIGVTKPATGGHDGTSPVATGKHIYVESRNGPFWNIDEWSLEEQIGSGERAGLDLANIPDGTPVEGRFWYRVQNAPGTGVNPILTNFSFRYFDDGDAEPTGPGPDGVPGTGDDTGVGVQSGNRDVIQRTSQVTLNGNGEWHQAVVPMNLKTAAERAATVGAGGTFDPDILTVWGMVVEMNTAASGNPAPTFNDPLILLIDRVELIVVPEPASLGVLGTAAMGLLARRRRA